MTDTAPTGTVSFVYEDVAPDEKTARVGAEVFGMDYADFAARTQANFDRLFSKAQLKAQAA